MNAAYLVQFLFDVSRLGRFQMFQSTFGSCALGNTIVPTDPFVGSFSKYFDGDPNPSAVC